MMAKPRRDEERDFEVHRLTMQGATAREIAEKLDIVPDTVHRIRKRMGIAQPAAVAMTEDQVRLAEMLIEDGCPASEVARTVGRSVGQIQKRWRGKLLLRGDPLHNHRDLMRQLGL